jgi:competence protein ComEC
VVLAIALASTALETRLRQWFEPDAFLVHDLRTRWQRGRAAALRWFAKAFAVSCAAWLGSLPLTAHYFHLVTTGSPVANILIVPLSGVALAGVVASLFCGALWPSVAEVFNHAAWACMNSMARLSEGFAELPGAAWFVSSPQHWETALFAAALLVPGFARFRPGWPGNIGLVAALALAGCLVGRAWNDHRTTRLTLLPLNGGHAIHFDAGGRSRDLLVDAGDQANAELVLRPFLRAHGVNRLSRLALTHGDVRHVGGTRTMVKAFGIEEAFLGDLRFRSTAYRRVVEELESSPVRVERVSDGGPVAGWRVLHPSADTRIALADDGAMVLLGEFDGFRWLLLSDLGRDGQEALLRRHGDNLRADIVVAGLPTRDEPLNDALLERIRPRLIVVADAERPASERATVELTRRLARQPCPVLFLRTEGSFTAEWTARGDCVVRTLAGTVLRLARE